MRVGVIGCGYWGPKLARNFSELPGAVLSWVSDLRQERLDHVACLYPGVRTTRDYRDVLGADTDAVAIATPVSTHQSLALAALRAGKHILVEKPLAASVTEAAAIVEEAARRDLIVMVGHTFEYNPAVEAVRAIMDAGTLGQIYYINGVRVNLGVFQPDINVMWDLAPHDVSILRFVLRADPLAVGARGAAYVQRKKGIHDVAYLCLLYTSPSPRDS